MKRHPICRGSVICGPAGPPPLLVAWVDADPFDGEDPPPVPVELPWDGPMTAAIDALGEPRKVDVAHGTPRFETTVTPLLGE